MSGFLKKKFWESRGARCLSDLIPFDLLIYMIFEKFKFKWSDYG